GRRHRRDTKHRARNTGSKAQAPRRSWADSAGSAGIGQKCSTSTTTPVPWMESAPQITHTMKLCVPALCALFIVSAAGAATVPAAPTTAQVEAWKRLFPAISPGPTPTVYEMTTSYQTLVKQATAENIA